MKKQILPLTVFALFACCSISRADITGAWWHDDGDYMIVCNTWNWNPATSALSMVGDQHGTPPEPGPGIPAHMLGWITTDTPDDPTLTLGSSIDNDTGGMWIGYQVNVVMSVPFSFVAPGPSVDNPAPDAAPNDNWFVAGVVAPTLQGAGPYAGLYEGTLEFSAGTPIGIGDELDFLYSIHFGGATSYAFTQEMIPVFSEVPEPGMLALAGMGGLMLALRLRRNGRKAA